MWQVIASSKPRSMLQLVSPPLRMTSSHSARSDMLFFCLAERFQYTENFPRYAGQAETSTDFGMHAKCGETEVYCCDALSAATSNLSRS